jgi:ribosome maturation protein SDO1
VIQVRIFISVADATSRLPIGFHEGVAFATKVRYKPSSTLIQFSLAQMSGTAMQIVRLQRSGVKVELLGKPGMVTKFRDGHCSMQDAILDDRVFSNVLKGDVASEADLAKIGCRGPELIELILKTGKYSLTAAEKREFVERRRLEVINYIHNNFVDSTTRRPHPVTRIEAALAEIHGTIDPDQDAEHNVSSLVPKLQSIIRLEQTSIDGTVKVPLARLGAVIGICCNLGKVGKEEYGPEHAFIEVSVGPGQYDDLVQQIGRVSGGEAVFQIKGASLPQGDEEAEKGKVAKRLGKGGRRRGK